MIGDLSLLLTVALQLALTAAPAIAAALLAVRFGIRDVPVLLGVALAASGTTAMVVFWAYFANPTIGRVSSYGVFLAAIAIIAWCWPAVRADRQLLRRLATPWALWALASIFLVFLGFLHGGTDSPLQTASIRFSGQLPSDNDVPHYFSNYLFENGHDVVPPPFPPDWLSSDRPPLQIGYVLAQRPFGWDVNTLHYQVIGVMLQQLWVIGVWALLCAARIGVRTRALVIVTVLVSDVAIVNGFFIWPKMLAAAFLLAAAALVIAPERSLRSEPAMAVLFACLLGLAMLAHGGSIFGIIPLAGLALVRGLPSWRWIGAALVTGALLLAPWSAYQRYFDPPGNRLLKLQLAGVLEVDGRGTTETLWDSYSDEGVGGTLENKANNFVEMSGGIEAVRDAGDAVGKVASGELAEGIAEVRNVRFLALLPALGLLLIAPFVMLARRTRVKRDSADWRFAVACLSITATGCLAWGLLLFGSSNSSTVVHQGSLALPVLALCGCVAGLRAAWPRFANLLIAVNALLLLILYAPYLEPGTLKVPAEDIPPAVTNAGDSYSVLAILFAAASLAGFALLAFRANGSARGGEAAGAAAQGSTH